MKFLGIKQRRWRTGNDEYPTEAPSGPQHALPHALGSLTQEGRALWGVMLLVIHGLGTGGDAGIFLGGGGLEWGPQGQPRTVGWL